ncbi:fimbrial protein [Caballeronia sp. TF1N1]|uniref:fimbrial protein n=1 Tax=Caballeronia sp. TF1N1 TaxID=2878153 RepID=UPI00351D95DE
MRLEPSLRTVRAFAWNGAVPGFSNVAALSGSPSAGGVGIQLYDSTGAVFPLSVYKTLSNFNSATGGTYNIPLTARYYRTGALTPGPANSTMTMTVLYQ